MKRFKKILFVNEIGSIAKTTPLRAAQLARNNNALLTLCDVSPELPRTFPELQAVHKEMRESQMHSQFENINLEGIKVKTKLLTGTPFIEIINEVQRGGHELVIKSAEGYGDILSSIFGETDMHLMRKCPCPLWIVKPSKLRKYASIIAAVDPDPELASNRELNKQILELAISLANQENSELHIVHTWHFLGERSFRSVRSTLTNKKVQKAEMEVKNTHKRWLKELLENHDLTDIRSRIHLVKGEPGKVIPGFVTKKRADLVVMGTISRTGVEGFFIGNTAEKILRAVDCSVLTLKPSSFKTPVRV